METSTREQICLGMFEEHALCAWWWREDQKSYYRECSLFGCAFSETAAALQTVGPTMIVDEVSVHVHDFGPWKCTADQMGVYIPPWQYKRHCHICNATQMAERLVREE